MTVKKTELEAVVGHDTPEKILDGMHAAIERAADENGFDTDPAYDAAYVLAASGQDAEAVLESIDPTLDLAKFALVEPEAAAEYVANAGIVFDRSAGFIDMWTKHYLEETQLSGSYLGAVSSVAPVAKQAGVGLPDLLVRVSSMAEYGHPPRNARRELMAFHKSEIRGGGDLDD